MKQSENANQLGYLTNTLQRCRHDMNTLLPYRINPNNTNKRSKKASNTNFDNNSHTNPDVKRPQMTTNDLKPTSNNKPVKRKKKQTERWCKH